MHTPRQVLSRRGKVSTRIRLAGTLIAATAALVALPTASAAAAGGGTSVSGSGGDGGGRCGDAKLVHGKAKIPDCAPLRVKKVVWAANEIRKKPYEWGGGHGSWKDNGYDCSGAISYALHGGRFLRHPLDSSGFMSWAQRGKGKWITVLANPGHAFLVVAGLRFDTSQVRGDGPGWSEQTHAESWRDYRKRQKSRF